MLTFENFQRIADQIHKDLVYLLLYFQGEPYLNPDFLKMAAYATQKGIFTATSTNAHYLDDANARATVESGIQEVIVSIDGATQETYEHYRVGGNLTKAIKGVKKLVDWREKLKAKTPCIVLQFLVVGPNEHEIAEIQALGKELGVDKVVLKTAQIVSFEEGSDLIPQNDRYSRYRKGPDGKYHLKNKLRNQCWKLWMGAEVTWDGRVLPCCFDKDGKYVMGDIREDNFREIWKNEAYRKFRSGILSSRKSVDICRNCTEGTRIWA